MKLSVYTLREMESRKMKNNNVLTLINHQNPYEIQRYSKTRKNTLFSNIEKARLLRLASLT